MTQLTLNHDHKREKEKLKSDHATKIGYAKISIGIFTNFRAIRMPAKRSLIDIYRQKPAVVVGNKPRGRLLQTIVNRARNETEIRGSKCKTTLLTDILEEKDS